MSDQIYDREKEREALIASLRSEIRVLESQFATANKEIERLSGKTGYCLECERLAKENIRYREALEKISKVELKYDPLIGQIVTSEHYEAAWLDCVEIAKAALSDGGGTRD